MRILIATLTLLLLAGCCRSAGSGVGKGLTDFTRGVGSGVDEGVLVNVRLTDEVARAGLASTTAKWAHKKVQIYLTSKAPFQGRLIAKAYNKEGSEIGRSVLEVAMSAEDAKYISFGFPPEMDTQLVHEYWVDVLK